MIIPINPAISVRKLEPVNAKIPPGSDVKTMTKCGSCTLYFLQSYTNNLFRGICIEGDGVQEADLCSELHRLIEFHGPINLSTCLPKSDGLWKKFLPQMEALMKLLTAKKGGGTVSKHIGSQSSENSYRFVYSQNLQYKAALESNMIIVSKISRDEADLVFKGSDRLIAKDQKASKNKSKSKRI